MKYPAQRSDSSLRLNVHFHSLVLDGVYVCQADGELCFCPLPSPTAEDIAAIARSPTWAGVNVHAGPAIDGRDRRRLERLCRYIAKPPLAQKRLELAPEGRRLIIRFKRAWRDGTHAVILDPLDFIARLVALIPPPRFHMLRYHGVLAAHAKHRQEVVPGRTAEPAEPIQLRLLPESAAVDIMACPKCEGRMALKRIANTAEDIAVVLAQVGLGPRRPPRSHPPLPGQLELEFAA